LDLDAVISCINTHIFEAYIKGSLENDVDCYNLKKLLKIDTLKGNWMARRQARQGADSPQNGYSAIFMPAKIRLPLHKGQGYSPGAPSFVESCLGNPFRPIVYRTTVTPQGITTWTTPRTL
jgi:hypothetical protein